MIYGLAGFFPTIVYFALAAMLRRTQSRRNSQCHFDNVVFQAKQPSSPDQIPALVLGCPWELAKAGRDVVLNSASPMPDEDHALAKRDRRETGTSRPAIFRLIGLSIPQPQRCR